MTVYNLSQFYNQLRVTSATLSLNSPVQVSRAAGGTIYSALTGPRLWQGSIQCADYTHEGNRRIEALLALVQTPGNYFQMTPPKGNRPINYAGSGFTDVATNGSQTAGNTLKLKGLPASFKVSAGDYLSFVGGGVHRLYQVAADVTAAVGGTVTVTLTQPIPTSLLPDADTDVRMLDPILTAQIVPGSVSYGSVGLASTSGLSFEFIQSVRV